MGTNNKDIWESLPWDIQVDILRRLSTKDLCEFESVCKDWQSIILMQINPNPNQEAFILHLHDAPKELKSYIEVLDSRGSYKFNIPNMYLKSY